MRCRRLRRRSGCLKSTVWRKIFRKDLVILKLIDYTMNCAKKFPHPPLTTSQNHAIIRKNHKQSQKIQEKDLTNMQIHGIIRQATSNKQQATSNKQQATSNKQQATSNKQQATSGLIPLYSRIQIATQSDFPFN